MGQGVPRDLSEALRWFRKAHAQGFEQAAAAIERVLQDQRQEQAAAAAPPSRSAPRTAASHSSTPPPSPIPIGTRVELRGLKGKPELNGQRGVVVSFDAASGRCKVKLEDGGGPFKLKAENLALL
jgi:TPR repeat protein